MLYLINYLKDGRLEISNNRAERSIKPFVIGRKNFLFAITPRGAQNSATMFSLVIANLFCPCLAFLLCQKLLSWFATKAFKLTVPLSRYGYLQIKAALRQ